MAMCHELTIDGELTGQVRGPAGRRPGLILVSWV